jgi:ADP-dependent NAD(P)H-hydrate dehydratase
MADYEEVEDSIFGRVIQPRRSTAHKGDNGVVAVVGGSRIFHGAPFFASMAALRAGADLVYLAVPKTIAVSIRALSPDLIVFPLADGKLTSGAAGALLKWLPEIDCMVLGPGLGRQRLDGARKLVGDVCLERKVKTLLDAEAQDASLFSMIKNKDCITTPHPGEFRRAFGVGAGDTLDERVRSVSQKAAEFGIVIVLKSYETVISDGSRTLVNRHGSPAMTCGGIGDTLSGVIGAFAAQAAGTDVRSVEVAAAASLAVSLAGIRACELRGFHIVATDIIDGLPSVLKPHDRSR